MPLPAPSYGGGYRRNPAGRRSVLPLPRAAYRALRHFPYACPPLVYPYSRALALWEADRLLGKSRRESISLEVQGQDGKPCLTVTETYCTGNTLYYIPLVPLHYLMQDRRRRRGAALLLGVCGYLFHRAGMPHYHDEGSYLYWQYDIIAEWVEADPEGWEQACYWQQRSQLHEAQHIGAVMQRRLWNSYSLEQLQANAEKLVPYDAYDRECVSLAWDCVQLMRDYRRKACTAMPT